MSKLRITCPSRGLPQVTSGFASEGLIIPKAFPCHDFVVYFTHDAGKMTFFFQPPEILWCSRNVFYQISGVLLSVKCFWRYSLQLRYHLSGFVSQGLVMPKRAFSRHDKKRHKEGSIPWGIGATSRGPSLASGSVSRSFRTRSHAPRSEPKIDTLYDPPSLSSFWGRTIVPKWRYRKGTHHPVPKCPRKKMPKRAFSRHDIVVYFTHDAGKWFRWLATGTTHVVSLYSVWCQVFSITEMSLKLSFTTSLSFRSVKCK